MTFSHTISNVRYTFSSLRELLAKATPLRSGDILAGVAARSAEERGRAVPTPNATAFPIFGLRASVIAKQLPSS